MAILGIVEVGWTPSSRRQPILNLPRDPKGTHLTSGLLYSSLTLQLIMVVYTCSGEECGRVFHQEPAYINHMLKHRKSDPPLHEMADEIVNEGGEYLRDLKTKRIRRA